MRAAELEVMDLHHQRLSLACSYHNYLAGYVVGHLLQDNGGHNVHISTG